MKMKTKHFLMMAGGFALGWWLYKKAEQQSSLQGLGESNPLVGRPQAFLRNRWNKGWATGSVLKKNTPRSPLVELDNVQSPVIAPFMITDAGFGRY